MKYKLFMQKSNNYLLDKLYEEQLRKIRDIKFTRREIDILACIFSGRSAKKIASILSLAPKTAETHIRNIMRKLECHSRENIIDFLEKSGEALAIRTFYSVLIAHKALEDFLKSISRPVIENIPICLIIYWKERKEHLDLVNQFATHLGLMGIRILRQGREIHATIPSAFTDSQQPQSDYAIYIINDEQLIELQSSEIITNIEKTAFILPENLLKEVSSENDEKNLLHIRNFGEYCHCLFLVLKHLLKNEDLEKRFLDFKQQYEGLSENRKTSSPASTSSQVGEALGTLESFFKRSQFFINKKNWLLMGCGLAIFFIFLVTIKEYLHIGSKKLPQEEFIHSELSIPTEEIFLSRPELIAEIDKNIKGVNGIQTVALIGIGGSGKTTIARQYARQQKVDILWEINGESRESLKGSFENLAYHLSKTQEDKARLKGLNEIKNPHEREKKIVSFVKEHLKACPSWMLIFDNVKEFNEISDYFPLDTNAWGKGSILLTTQNENIRNNKHINHIIQIGTLTPTEKLSLFFKIMRNKDRQTLTSKEEIDCFLREIPPFPLDIVIAANYIKATNISYGQYLKYLKDYESEFLNIQENILNDSDEYTNTRFSLITLSLKQLINKNPEFKDLILFLCLVDSQNIPRGVLERYKNSVLVDEFIYNLKKYSLIMNETPHVFLGPVISMHRTIQALTLAYLTKELNLGRNHPSLKNISLTLKDYIFDTIYKEDYSQAELLGSHIITFLSHNKLLQDDTKDSMLGTLGCIYCHLNYYKKAKEILEESIGKLAKNAVNKDQKFARLLGCLGIAYRETACFEKAQAPLEESLQIYKNQSIKDYAEIARILTYLATVYKDLGYYDKSLQLLEESIEIYKSHFPKNYIGLARSLTYLGSVYREQGNNQKSKQVLEQSVLIYEKNPSNHIWMARTLVHLGSVYREIGDYKKAKLLLEEALTLYKRYTYESYVGVPWALMQLAMVYKENGELEEAETLLEKSLSIYKKDFPADHFDIALALSYLGNVYREKGELKKAINLLEHSLSLYKTKTHYENHVRAVVTLIYLGSAYRELGGFAEAINLLEEGIKRRERIYGQNHIETARAIRELGKTYLLKNEMETARNLLNKSLVIFQEDKHPEQYTCLECLADLYIKLSESPLNKTEDKNLKGAKEQAYHYLQEALEIARANFPKNSIHIIRLQSKLLSLH